MRRTGQSPKRPFFAIAAVLSAAAWLVPAAPAAYAQADSPSSSLPNSTDTKPNITEQKLDAVAAALEKIADLRQSYQQQFDAAEPADKERIADEATGALTKAVTDQGLSVDEYAAIMVIAQNDAGIREKIIQRIPSQDKQSQ